MKLRLYLRYIPLVLWCLFTLAPFLWALVTSFKTDAAVSTRATYLPWVDFEPSLKGWKELFNPSGVDIRQPYLTSILISTVATFASVSLGCLAAYGLSRFSYRFGRMRNSDITFFFVSQRILPPMVLALPYFILMRKLGLLDTIWGLMVVYTAMLLPVTVWVLTPYFSGVPRSLDEAVLVDGGSYFTSFWRVALPLTRPGIAVAVILAAVFAWNDFLFALTLTFTRAQTLPVTIVALNSSKVPWWSLSASSLAAVIPPMFLAFALERYMIKGALAGSFR